MRPFFYEKFNSIKIQSGDYGAFSNIISGIDCACWDLFSKNKKIISLISTLNLEKLKSFTKAKNIVRATPLPPIEIKRGPIIICPPNKFAKNIFKHLGKVLEIRNEKLSYKFWSTASLMAAFYEILNISSKWLVKKGINKRLINRK